MIHVIASIFIKEGRLDDIKGIYAIPWPFEIVLVSAICFLWMATVYSIWRPPGGEGLLIVSSHLLGSTLIS